MVDIDEAKAVKSPKESAGTISESQMAPVAERGALGRVTRVSLIVIGTFSLAIGIVGVFVPILPTTPFLLLSAACYMRSSERFYKWLISNRLFGNYVKNYIERRGVPLGVKVSSLALLWITIGFSAGLATDIMWVRVLLVLIATGVTIHILSLRTLAH